MIFYTDGACSGNPGPGGFGVAIYNDDGSLNSTYSEQCDNTTNNREEIKAILYVMQIYGEPWCEGARPLVYSDSAYCVNMFNDWIFKWANNNWKRSKNQEILNLDLVKKYYLLYEQGHRIDLRKVNGHHGIEGNEIADALAKGTYKI